MSKLDLAPIERGDSLLQIDHAEWSQRIGDGGFGVAYGNPADARHVLKCMDAEIDMESAIPAMSRLTSHAKVMRKRLSAITRDPNTSPFVKGICELLLSTITTHVGYCADERRIYLFQRKAPGRSLEASLNDKMPSWQQRVRIAKSFASVMVALRRCNVIHLDCRPVNVFVDASVSPPRVTLIDLDGCGVLFDRESDGFKDAWETPPATMGHDEQMCRPIWFPWDPTWQTPLAGHFKFAERWCVINEVWRILSWGNAPALGWLEPEHDDLFEGADLVQEMFRSVCSNSIRPQECLVRCQRAIAIELNDTFDAALEHTCSIRWGEYGVGSGDPDDEDFFSSFGMWTLRSFMNPKDQRLPQAVWPPYAPEIPCALWIQKELHRRYGD